MFFVFKFVGTITKQTGQHISGQEMAARLWITGSGRRSDPGGIRAEEPRAGVRGGDEGFRPTRPCRPRRGSETPGTLEGAEVGLKIKDRCK